MTLRELVKDYDAETLYPYLLAHPKIWADALQDGPIITRMLDQLIRDERRGFRQDVHRTMAQTAGDTPEDREKRLAGQDRLHGRMHSTLFDWAIFAGKKLRECRRGDLAASVTSRREQSARQELAAEFEEAVAARLPNGRVTVGKTLTTEQLSEIYQGVYMADAA